MPWIALSEEEKESNNHQREYSNKALDSLASPVLLIPTPFTALQWEMLKFLIKDIIEDNERE